MPTFGVAMRYPRDMQGFLHKLHEHSIGAYEIGFASGIPDNFPDETIKLADELKIKLSGHMPFFLSWADEEKTLNSIGHIVKGIKFAGRLKTLSICHLGHYGAKSFGELEGTVVQKIRDAVNLTAGYYNRSNPVLGIETTGKRSEIGSLDEVLSIVRELSTDLAVPVIDWAHIFARADGKFPRSVDDFRSVLTRLETELGVNRFYFHGSGIEYRNGQEVRHLTVKICSPPLPFLFSVLNDGGYDYTLIIESPNAIEDLMWVREVSNSPEQYFDFVQKQKGALERWMVG